MIVRMLSLSTLAFGSIPTVVVAAQPAPAPQAPAPPLVCDSKLASGYPLPATLPSDALIRDIPARPLVHSATETEIVCGVFSRPWKSQRTPSYLVFLETGTFRRESLASAKAELAGRRLRSAVYRQAGDGQYQLIARSAEPLDLPNGTELDDLDLAPFKMTDTDFAFGVRTTAQFDGCEGSYCHGSSEILQLFRVDGKVIRPILTTLLWSEAETIGPANDDGSRDHDTLGDKTPARISVLKTRSGGVFDWKKAKGRNTAILKWTGDRYASDDEDPVTDQNH